MDRFSPSRLRLLRSCTLQWTNINTFVLCGWVALPEFAKTKGKVMSQVFLICLDVLHSHSGAASLIMTHMDFWIQRVSLIIA